MGAGYAQTSALADLGRHRPIHTTPVQKLGRGIVVRCPENSRAAMSRIMSTKDQISVPVDAALRAAVERAAQSEHRTVAGQIRHWIATALDRAANKPTGIAA